VYEVKNPALKPKPLGIKQKNILATCNYNARRRGVKKLMLITEAKKICPELVIVEGEDLTPFRDVSKILFNFFKSYSWNQKVERLGFDEVFMGASYHCFKPVVFRNPDPASTIRLCLDLASDIGSLVRRCDRHY
jgi:nucleotidyltransferase/DNA polymerase involved in DNA repair